MALRSTPLPPASRPYDWRIVALFFLLIGLAYVLKAIYGTTPLLNDTDDAMRLVEVRDLLGGQAWYDLVQHRMNLPFGGDMHWSRLVDAPIAGLILLLRPLFGAQAEQITLFVWPLLLLLALLALSGWLAVRLAGPEGLLPGVALPGFSIITLTEFAPGRIDHHSVQILLALVMLAALFEVIDKRPRFALLGGLAAAASIGVGVESLPAVGAAIAAQGLLYVLDREHRAGLFWFGLSFALSTLVLLAAALPPERWFTPYCDAISAPFALVAVAVGAGFVLLALLAPRHWGGRLALGTVAGAAVIALLVIAYPQCLRAPYANLDPYLLSHWIARIDEARPVWELGLKDLPYLIGVGVPALLALLVALIGLLRSDGARRERLVAYAVFVCLALAVMALQIRGARLATSLAAPGAAVLIASLRARFVARRSPLTLIGLVGAWMASAGLVLGLVAALLVPEDTTEKAAAKEAADAMACRRPTAFASLAALPPSRLLAPVDLGSHLLAFTPHAVVAGPYHRNGSGLLDTYRIFNGPIAEARTILAARGIDYLVLCPGMPELRGQPDAAPDSLVKLYARGALPDFLVRVPLASTPLELYRVAQ